MPILTLLPTLFNYENLEWNMRWSPSPIGRFNGKYTSFLNNCHGYESLLVAEFCEFIEVKKEKLFCPYSG